MIIEFESKIKIKNKILQIPIQYIFKIPQNFLFESFAESLILRNFANDSRNGCVNSLSTRNHDIMKRRSYGALF